MNKYTIKQDGNVLGVIDGDVLRIIKMSPEHYVRKYRGYGISPSTLDHAEARGASMLELQGWDGRVFLLPIRDFRAAAIPDNIGSGRQLFLSCRWLKYYTDRAKAESMPKQLMLFA